MRTRLYIWYNRGPDLGVLEVISMGLCGCNQTCHKGTNDIKYAGAETVTEEIFFIQKELGGLRR